MRALSTTRWVVVALLAVLLIVPAWLVHFHGASIVQVAGGSMAPFMHRGDVVIITPVEPDALEAGMVVTAEDADGTYVTHRIQEVDADGVHLKGDANLATDVAVRSPQQVLGEVRVVLGSPVGEALVALQSWPLRISVLVMVIGLAAMPFSDRHGGSRVAPRRMVVHEAVGS